MSSVYIIHIFDSFFHFLSLCLSSCLTTVSVEPRIKLVFSATRNHNPKSDPRIGKVPSQTIFPVSWDGVLRTQDLKLFPRYSRVSTPSPTPGVSFSSLLLRFPSFPFSPRFPCPLSCVSFSPSKGFLLISPLRGFLFFFSFCRVSFSSRRFPTFPFSPEVPSLLSYFL